MKANLSPTSELERERERECVTYKKTIDSLGSKLCGLSLTYQHYSYSGLFAERCHIIFKGKIVFLVVKIRKTSHSIYPYRYNALQIQPQILVSLGKPWNGKLLELGCHSDLVSQGNELISTTDSKANVTGDERLKPTLLQPACFHIFSN